MQSVSAMPVATGTTKQAAAERAPHCRSTSSTRSLVSRFSRLDPAAFGCTSHCVKRVGMGGAIRIQMMTKANAIYKYFLLLY